MDQNEQPRTDDQLHDWATSLVEDGVARRRAWEGIWWENIATYAGDLWTRWNISSNRLEEPIKKADYKVRLPINLAQPAVRTELSKLTKNRPLCNVLPKSNDQEDLTAAQTADKLLNNYAEKQFSLPRVRRRMLQWVLMCGLGGIFVDWDDQAEKSLEFLATPDGDPVVDPRVIEAYRTYYRKRKKRPKTVQMPQGEIIVKAVSPFQVLFDYSQLFIEDAGWVIVSEVMDVNEVYRRWKVEVDPDNQAIPGVIERRYLAKYDLSGQFINTNQVGAQQLVTVHRLFVKPNHRYFPDGAHVVFTDSELIVKEVFPFLHGELPVSMMGHIPFPVTQYPMSILQQLRGPVLELSRTTSQLIENRNLMANPPWVIAKQLQIKGETIRNRPGMKLEYTHVPNVPPPNPVQMPEMPGYVKTLMDTMKDFIMAISGQGETSQGQVPTGARSGVAIAYLQESDDTRLGPTIQEYEETIESMSTQVLELMAQFYTTPRTVRIYKRDSELEVFDFYGAMLAGNTQVMVQAGSALPRSKAAKQQFYFDLWDRKLIQDPRKMFQALELGDAEPDDWELDLDQAQRENRLLQMGQQVGVELWYNHQAHHYEHRKFMKSSTFEKMADPIKQLFRDHDALHTQAEQLAAQQQAGLQGQLQMMSGGPQGGEPMAPPESNQTAELPPGIGGGGGQPAEGAPSQFQGAQPGPSLVDAHPQ